MKKFISVLKNTQMFAGVSGQEIESMLGCLGTRMQSYKKGETIVCQGRRLDDVLLLVEGSAHIQSDDYWGNRSILGHIGVGGMFGEAYACHSGEALLNDVVAVENCTVFFFDVKRIITTCPSACRFHTMVVKNMFFAISQKNRQLVQKLSHMSGRTTRAKLISYLSEQAKKNNSASFVIPFNRQQLADFLSVDRSAMSNELCKMRDEGLIKFEKNAFTLLS